jgi:hypothetical protein
MAEMRIERIYLVDPLWTCVGRARKSVRCVVMICVDEREGGALYVPMDAGPILWIGAVVPIWRVPLLLDTKIDLRIS